MALICSQHDCTKLVSSGPNTSQCFHKRREVLFKTNWNNQLVEHCFTSGLWPLLTSFLIFFDDIMVTDNETLTLLATVNKQCASNVRMLSISQARIQLTFQSALVSEKIWEDICARYVCSSVRQLRINCPPNASKVYLSMRDQFPNLRSLFLDIDSKHVDLRRTLANLPYLHTLVLKHANQSHIHNLPSTIVHCVLIEPVYYHCEPMEVKRLRRLKTLDIRTGT